IGRVACGFRSAELRRHTSPGRWLTLSLTESNKRGAPTQATRAGHLQCPPSRHRCLRQVRVQPAKRARPGIARTGLVVGRADVAVEAVAGVRVADDLRVDGRGGDGLTQLLDLLDRDALVLIAVAAEPRRLQRRREILERRRAEAALNDPAAVEGDRGAQRSLRSLDEGDGAAHAEAY